MIPLSASMPRWRLEQASLLRPLVREMLLLPHGYVCSTFFVLLIYDSTFCVYVKLCLSCVCVCVMFVLSMLCFPAGFFLVLFSWNWRKPQTWSPQPSSLPSHHLLCPAPRKVEAEFLGFFRQVMQGQLGLILIRVSFASTYVGSRSSCSEGPFPNPSL